MSFEGLFSTTQQKQIPTKTGGIFGNVFAGKKPVEIKPIKRDIRTLPSGKGQYIYAPPETKYEDLSRLPRAYGTFETVKEKERDHKFPVSLGGTSFDPNIQMLESKRDVIDKILKKPADAKDRQEGKMLVEWKNINDYKAGKIGINEARTNVLNWNNQPEKFYKLYAKEFLKSSTIEAPQKIAGVFGNLFGKVSKSLESIRKGGVEKTGIDPDLKRRLEERGEIDKIKELEEPTELFNFDNSKTKKFTAKTGAAFGQLATSATDFYTDLILRNPTKIIQAQGLSPVASILKPAQEQWREVYSKIQDKMPTEKAKVFAEKINKSDYLQPSQDWIDASTQEKFSKKYIGQTLFEIGPSVIASMGSFAINPAMGMGMVVGATADDVKSEAIKYGVPEERAEYLGLATGVAVGLLERIVPSRLFGKMRQQAIKVFAKKLIENTILEPLTEMTQEGIQMLAEKTFKDLNLGEITSRLAFSARWCIRWCGNDNFSTIYSKCEEWQCRFKY